jgi:hypothetical protein
MEKKCMANTQFFVTELWEEISITLKEEAEECCKQCKNGKKLMDIIEKFNQRKQIYLVQILQERENNPDFRVFSHIFHEQCSWKILWCLNCPLIIDFQTLFAKEAGLAHENQM